MFAHRLSLPTGLVGAVLLTGTLLSGCASTSTTSSGSTSAGSAASSLTSTAPTATTAGTVVPGPVEIKTVSTEFGPALGRADGKVLYTWDQEVGGTAKCIDAACVEKWPPLLATRVTAGAGLDAMAYTLVDRPDGTKQVAVGGRRLYTMSQDAPGEANCQGGDGWFIVNPDGTKNATLPGAAK